ncbi:MAG: VOC family protein [Dermatophilaceae bacterium]
MATWAADVAFVAAIGQAAESVDHYLDVDWRYDHVFVRSTTHQAGDEVTEQDIRLATRISAIAAAAGAGAVAVAVAEPTLARTVEIGMDSADPDALKSTWQTALGYRLGRSGDLVDPWGRGPTLWFQRTETPATSRLHLDVHVAPESALEVVDAVESAGGRRLDERFAPSWWVIADAEGNRLCVCTPHQAPPLP